MLEEYTRLIDKEFLLVKMTELCCEIVKVRLVGVGMFTLAEGKHYCAGWKVEFSTYKDRAGAPVTVRMVRRQ